MSTPEGFDPRQDPTAPSYEPSTPETPTYEPPTYEPPTYEPPTYEPPTYEPPTYGSPTYGPPSYGPPTDAAAPGAQQPAETDWYLAPPPASALPPLPGESHPNAYPPDAYPPGSYPPGGYAPPGSASYPPPAPRRTAGAVWALVVGVIVVLALGVVGVVTLLGPDDATSTARSTPTAPPTTSSPSPTGSSTGATTDPSSGSASTAPSGAAEVMVPAVTPGFQGVLSQQENVAYDVPAGWEVQTPTTLVGFEDGSGKPLAVIHGVSTFRPDACPDVRGSNRGNAGFKTAGTVPPAEAVEAGVKVFADAAALNDDGSSAPVTAGTVTDVKVDRGRIAAKMTTATITPPAGAACGAPTVVFTGVAFTAPSGETALFIMYLDQGTSDALSPALAQQIVTSLRPYTG